MLTVIFSCVAILSHLPACERRGLFNWLLSFAFLADGSGVSCLALGPLLVLMLLEPCAAFCSPDRNEIDITFISIMYIFYKAEKYRKNSLNILIDIVYQCDYLLFSVVHCHALQLVGDVAWMTVIPYCVN